jgi:hypothetical protein
MHPSAVSAPRLIAEYATADEYLSAHDEEVAAGGLCVRGASLPAGTPLSDCTVLVRIAGRDEAEASAKLASVSNAQGAMVVFLEEPAALQALAQKLRTPDAARRASRGRREALSTPEKMQLAAACDRELRLELLRDPNKLLHPLVLRNPRIGVEEVLFAARLPTLNPDALKLIGEHPEWGQNATIVSALVRNPHTPLPMAVRLVPRLPRAELRALASSQGRPQIVQAAKKEMLR